jgi:hypothetical protein
MLASSPGPFSLERRGVKIRKEIKSLPLRGRDLGRGNNLPTFIMFHLIDIIYFWRLFNLFKDEEQRHTNESE